MNKVLITGAAGFVGGHLKNHLEEKGYEVFSVTRTNLDDPFSVESWKKTLEKAECEAVVHLIAKTHAADAGDPASLPSYRHINVDITKALLEASQTCGVKKFVYLSSIKAVGEETPIDEPFTEESLCRPEDCYGISKREAEEIVLGYSKATNAVIIRPPLIYGPGVKGNFLRLLKAVKRGIPLPFASVRNARSFLFAGNLSHAIERAIKISLGGGRVFHISDQETPSTPELLRLIAASLNANIILLPCPPGLLESIAVLAGKYNSIKKLSRSLKVSNALARQILGWEPVFSMEKALSLSFSMDNDLCKK